jgi:hypothetical protein
MNNKDSAISFLRLASSGNVRQASIPISTHSSAALDLGEQARRKGEA